MWGMGDEGGGGWLGHSNSQNLTHFLLHEALTCRSINCFSPVSRMLLAHNSVQRLPSEVNELHLYIAVEE